MDLTRARGEERPRRPAANTPMKRLAPLNSFISWEDGGEGARGLGRPGEKPTDGGGPDGGSKKPRALAACFLPAHEPPRTVAGGRAAGGRAAAGAQVERGMCAAHGGGRLGR